MSDIKSLVISKVSNLLNENLTLAGEKCRKADQCIMKAKNSGGRDKELVKQALKLYEESIELYSKQAQPYIGIAYIAYSAGNIEYAIGLLNKAREIEPSNSNVKEMLELFKEEFKQRNVSAAISKVAGKSLSEKIEGGKRKVNINIFEKITSIFSKSVTKPQPSITAAIAGNPAGSSKATVTIVSRNSGNFFENIRSTSLNKFPQK